MGDDEVAARKDPAPFGAVILSEVLHAETGQLRTSLLGDLKPSTFNDAARQRDGNLREIYRRVTSLRNADPAQRASVGSHLNPP